MSHLKIFKNEELIQQMALIDGKEYILGRANDCDIVLEGSRGVSRKHLKISGENSVWKVEVLSQYGELYFEGEKVENIELLGNKTFNVPPYEFVFETEEINLSPADAAAPEVLAEVFAHTGSLSGQTRVGVIQATAFFVAYGPNGESSKIFQLEGNTWIAGRDSSCPIYIDDNKFSRQHFEVSLQNGEYFVKDLGSSNGTRLNGQLISTTDWTQIVSGDVLMVVDWTINFELRDSNFDDQVRDLSPEFRSPMVYQSAGQEPMHAPSPTPYQPPRNQPPPYYGPPPMGVVTNSRQSSGSTKNNWVRMAIVVVVAFAGIMYFMDSPEKPAAPVVQVKPTADKSPFDRLRPDQQQYVRDTYRLADRLFKEGRYEMARQEITKIHELVPSFEESKNLEKLSDVAIQTIIDQKRAEVKEKEMAEMEEKIQSTVAQCSRLVNSAVESKKVEDCLSPIIVLNPDHPAIASLRARVEQIISDRAIKNEERAEYRALVKKHASLYSIAESLDKKGKAWEAIDAYNRVLASKLPDPQNLKGKAQRQIASIQKNMSDQQSRFEKEADSAYKGGDAKTAVKKLKQALLINSENEAVKGKINLILSDLKKQTQVLYQEGVLEESVGEVETAKAKWKKIIEISIPEEDYYKKARSKLKKYGIE